MPVMLGRPEPNEAAPYYSRYIDLIASDDVLSVLDTQLVETLAFLGGISEEQSGHRYEPGKWSMKQLLNHVNDTERIFLFRALWFARGFPGSLPGYDQDIGVVSSGADEVSWSAHVEEFRAIRLSSLALLKNLPEEAWLRSGVANDSPATVRGLAYILAGHVAHHSEILRSRYL